MARVRLIHWNAAEARERARALRAAGHEVDFSPFDRVSLRALRDDPPLAVVVDLSRLPMQGRDVALAVRRYKSTRQVPLVFVGGEPGKVARVKELLGDAVYATWDGIGPALKRALVRPAPAPAAPLSLLAGYSGTPLPKKLGIKAGSVVALVGAPGGFARTLGRLPEGVVLRPRASGRPDLVVWFARSRSDLARRVRRMGALAGKGGLWIAWPKKASGIRTDLTQAVVREVVLAAGLVDYKVCAMDEAWAGLRFTWRQRA